MAAPSWSDGQRVLAPVKIAAGSQFIVRPAITDYFGAYLFIRAMRLSGSAPSNGIYIGVRRQLVGTPSGGAGSVYVVHSNTVSAFQDTTAASNLTTLSATPGIPGNIISLTSGTGFAAGQFCGIIDSTTTPGVIEFTRTSKISGTTLTLDRNLENTAIASGNTITNNAIIIPPIWLDGVQQQGDIEIVFDNGAETTVAYAAEVWMQTLNSID